MTDSDVLSFPTDVAEFDQDERISYSKLDKKYIAVHDDGTEFEFNPKLKSWVVIDDEEDTVDGHGAPSADGVSRSPSAQIENDSRKRKDGPARDDESTDSSRNPRSRPPKRPKQPPAPRQNTAVYVTGLPPDATVDEVNELFSRKGGVIAEEIDSGRPRIKLYTDNEGNFKGDALVVFFKPQSVNMAIMLLDDTDFRLTPSGLSSGRIRVQPADSSYKKTTYDDDTTGDGTKDNNGSKPAQPAKNNRDRDRDRQKIIKKTQKLESKLADWDDDDIPLKPENTKRPKWEKTVILKHMFTLEELDDDPAALLEIKEDIRDECERLGAVTNVVLFDLEPTGIVSVKFREMDAALECVRLMHGRSFDGRVVEAALATEAVKFRKSNKEADDEEED